MAHHRFLQQRENVSHNMHSNMAHASGP